MCRKACNAMCRNACNLSRLSNETRQQTLECSRGLGHGCLVSYICMPVFCYIDGAMELRSGDGTMQLRSLYAAMQLACLISWACLI